VSSLKLWGKQGWWPSYVITWMHGSLSQNGYVPPLTTDFTLNCFLDLRISPL
jgi:hypothetical protein